MGNAVDSTQQVRRAPAPVIVPESPAPTQQPNLDPTAQASATLQAQVGNTEIAADLSGSSDMGGDLQQQLENAEQGPQGNAARAEELEDEIQDEGMEALTEAATSESDIEQETEGESSEGMSEAQGESESGDAQDSGADAARDALMKNQPPKRKPHQETQKKEKEGPKNDGHLPRDENGNVKIK